MIAARPSRAGLVDSLNAALAAVDGGVASVRVVDGRGARYADGPGTTVRLVQMEAVQ